MNEKRKGVMGEYLGKERDLGKMRNGEIGRVEDELKEGGRKRVG